MNNIERDEERLLKIYYSGTEDAFTWSWFSTRYVFLSYVPDISEEFHRNYCRFYNGSQWSRLFIFQTKVSEQFYDDFFDKIDRDSFVWLIRNSRVSIGWIERNKHRIPPEVWEKVYE